MAVLKTASNFQYFAPITSRVIRVDTRGPGQSDMSHAAVDSEFRDRSTRSIRSRIGASARRGAPVAKRQGSTSRDRSPIDTTSRRSPSHEVPFSSPTRAARPRSSLAVAALTTAAGACAADLQGRPLRVAHRRRTSTNFDPQQFSTVNFPLIKNLYDSLLEYTPDGKAVPSLATAWKIAPDNTSVTVTLRKDVKFHSGAPLQRRGGRGEPRRRPPIRRRARTSTPPCPS